MTDFITLACPSCGGQLGITDDIHRFVCTHCGTEHIVKRAPGIIAIEPVVQGLVNIQRGVDRTATELAMVRLKGEIEKEWQKEQSLAAGLLRSDFNGAVNALARIGIISGLRKFGLSPRNKKDLNYVYIELLELTTQETMDAAERYWATTPIRNKKAIKTHTILQQIKVIKLRISALKRELKEHEDILR